MDEVGAVDDQQVVGEQRGGGRPGDRGGDLGDEPSAGHRGAMVVVETGGRSMEGGVEPSRLTDVSVQGDPVGTGGGVDRDVEPEAVQCLQRPVEAVDLVHGVAFRACSASGRRSDLAMESGQLACLHQVRLT